MSVKDSSDADGEPPDLLDRMVGAAGARPSDQVTIAGSDIELLVGLSRRGFAQAACALPGRAPAAGETDILLIPRIASPDDLALIMGRLGRCLHPGGTAVIHDTGARTRARLARLGRVLGAFGLAVLGRVPCAGGVILAARKIGGPVELAA